MGLISCINKLSRGKNQNLFSPEERAELRNRTAQYSRQMPVEEAERRAVQDLLNSAKQEHAGVTEKPVMRSNRPIARDIRPKDFKDRIKEFIGLGDRNFGDYFANKFLGKAHSVIGKEYRAGTSGGWSKTNVGRVSAESANWQGNNAIGLVSQALQRGWMKVFPDGRVKAMEDPTVNISTMNHKYKAIRDQLAKMGYRDKEKSPDDPDTITNATALALFGPRIEELVKIGQFHEHYYTDGQKAMSDKLRADPTLRPLLDDFQKTYNDLRGHAIDALVDSGVFTKEKAKEFMDRYEYLPLYRMDEELKNNLGEPTYMNSLLAAGREHHLGYGSEDSIGDPMHNAFDNLAWLNTRAVKNNTANVLAESLVATDHAKWVKVKPPGADNVIEMMRDGKKAYLKLKDLNDISAFTSTPVMTGFGWKMARAFTNFVRRGVTIMPGFIWGQTSQDAQRVAMMTGQTFRKAYMDDLTSVVRETHRAWSKNPDETPAQKALREYGILAARDFTDSMDNFRKEMLEQPKSKWYNVLEKLEQTATASDGASREAAYKKRFADAKTAGMDDVTADWEAAHAARMLIDFNNRGNSRTLAALMQVVPFINARIQGNHRMFDALMGKIPGIDKEVAKDMAMKQLAKLMAFTLAYTLVKQGDDEYENETQAVRNNNFLFPGGLKMPVAGELLPFKVMAESIARQMLDDPNEDWSKTRDSLANAASNVLLGPSDMVPSIVRPIIENVTNHSFTTGHELIGKGLQHLSPEQQYTQNTTSVSKELAHGIAEAGQFIGYNGVSPIMIENFLTSWLGRTGQEALNLIRNMESLAGARPAPHLSELTGIGSFFANPQGHALRQDFQEVVDKVQAAQADYKDLMDRRQYDDARQYRKDHQDLFALAGQITPIQQRLSALSKQAKAGTLTADKRDKLYAQQVALLQRVHDLRQRAGF